MPPDPNPHDTAEYPHEEIMARLEMGRLEVKATEEGSQLVVLDAKAPGLERRTPRSGHPPDMVERRKRHPLYIPTHFPEKGAIGLLLVGGFADDKALKRPLPFWSDDGGGYLVWEAVRRAGLLHKRDEDFLLGRGGYWDEKPPRTQNLAMTYCGYAPEGEPLSFARATGSWNVHRLQTLIQGCFERSMNRLKLVTIGDPARFMACACAYGIPDITLLSIPAPEPQILDDMDLGAYSAAQYWIDWASDMLAIGRG